MARYLAGFVFVLASCSSSESGLATQFGDCASPPCEVALEAFTMSPDTLPHCESNRDAVDPSCPVGSEAWLTGDCGEYWAVRLVYGFPGDFYECIYGADQGELVGAKWSPDNHPTQFAGEQLPPDCSLPAICGS